MKSNEDTEIIRDSAKFCPSHPEATWHCKNVLIMWKKRNEGLKKKKEESNGRNIYVQGIMLVI